MGLRKISFCVGKMMYSRLTTFIDNLSSIKQIHSIKKDVELYNWVCAESLKLGVPSSNSVSEKIYIILNPSVTVTCCNGKNKKFISFTKGYSQFCGNAASCKCYKDQVSKKISDTMLAFSSEKKDAIKKQRELTLMNQFDVTHNSQIPGRKERLQQLYKETDIGKKAAEKHKKTVLEKYGVSHIMQVDKFIQKKQQTIMQKYNVKHPMLDKVVVNKVLATKKDKYPDNFIAKNYGYNLLKQTLESKFNLQLLTSKDDYVGSYQKKENQLRFKCLKCNNEFTGMMTYSHKTRCRICEPTLFSNNSSEENAVCAFLKNDLNLTIEQRNRSIISPYELDIVIPEMKIAIEYCGLYWHTEFIGDKDKNYHVQKMNLARDKGYRLITVFSDEWVLKEDLVKAVLRSQLNIKSCKRHYARKLTVKTVAFDEVRHFLNTNHLQGSGYPTQYNYVLCDKNDEIIMCMTFSKVRKMLGNKHATNIDNKWELVRLCTKQNETVVGGANRLFAFFLKMNDPDSIISYCDKRWFDGTVYRNLQFVQCQDTKPGYWYVKNNIRYSRTKFTKQRISNSENINKTEKEIMLDLGYDRIWDCGHYKFIWQKNNKIN